VNKKTQLTDSIEKLKETIKPIFKDSQEIYDIYRISKNAKGKLF
jgi:hypothetical protein